MPDASRLRSTGSPRSSPPMPPARSYRPSTKRVRRTSRMRSEWRRRRAVAAADARLFRPRHLHLKFSGAARSPLRARGLGHAHTLLGLLGAPLRRSLPPCGGGTGRGVAARTELCLLLLCNRSITREISPNLFCPRVASSAALAATPLPVPPPRKARSRASSTRYGGREPSNNARARGGV